jgi:hypothetical protein
MMICQLSQGEADLNNEEDTAPEDNPTATKVDDDTISDNDSRLQLDVDSNLEESTESQIPSSILRFILEP